MRKQLLFLAVVLTVNFVDAQHYVTVNENSLKNLKKENIPLTSVQFYNQRRITLLRTITDRREINNIKGVIKYKNGRAYEKIIIPRKTKGVFVKAFDNGLAISFDEKNDSLYLVFKNFCKPTQKINGYAIQENKSSYYYSEYRCNEYRMLNGGFEIAVIDDGTDGWSWRNPPILFGKYSVRKSRDWNLSPRTLIFRTDYESSKETNKKKMKGREL